MNESQFEDNEEALSRNLRYRRGRWWRREATLSVALLALLSAIAVCSGVALVIASYHVLCPTG